MLMKLSLAIFLFRMVHGQLIMAFKIQVVVNLITQLTSLEETVRVCERMSLQSLGSLDNQVQ